MLDAWWKTLAARLDAAPAALHRLPEPIAHIAEALWMQALEQAKRRATLEQRDSARLTELDKQRLELRSTCSLCAKANSTPACTTATAPSKS